MKTIVRVTSAILIFVAPVILVLTRYQSETTEEAITSGLGIVPTLFIIAIGAVSYSFVSQQFLEMVRTDKFGYLSIAFFGVLLAILGVFGLLILSSIQNAAETNYERFIATFEYHQQTLLYILLLVGTGIAEIFIYKAATIKIKP